MLRHETRTMTLIPDDLRDVTAILQYLVSHVPVRLISLARGILLSRMGPSLKMGGGGQGRGLSERPLAENKRDFGPKIQRHIVLKEKRGLSERPGRKR